MRKKTYGQGSFFQRSSDGRWVGKVPDGRGGHRSVSGTDESETRARWRDLRRALRDRTTSTSRRGGERLRDYLPRWLEAYAATGPRHRTVHGHRLIVDHHLVPWLGRFRVEDIEVADVQRMVNDLARRRAPNTVHNVVRTLSVALKDAQREGLVEHNVARLAKLPQRRREPLPSLSTANVMRFLDANRPHPHWPIWVLCAQLGLRRGEVLALRWQDVDLAAATVMVSGTYRQVVLRNDAGKVTGHRWVREEPKTPKSRRLLYLPALSVSALRQQKARATSAVVVFARPDGEPLYADDVLRRFQDTLVAGGYPKVRLHSLRHSAAVAMLDTLGGDIRAVSATLGHATIGITVDTYGSQADEARKRAAAAMDKAMEGMG